MRITRAENGTTILALDSWEEAGIKIVLPTPRRSEDQLNRALYRVPVEISLSMGEEADALGLDTLARINVQPTWCPHGFPDAIEVELDSDASAVHFSYLTFPFDDGDGVAPHEEDEDHDGE